MGNYYFRICFEKEFEDERDARDYLENLIDSFYNYKIKELFCEIKKIN